MSRVSRPILSVGFISILAVLATDSVLTFRGLETIGRAHEQVGQSRVVIVELEQILSLLKDAETGQRGYLLTGRDDYLGPYQGAEAEIGPALARLRSLTSDHDGQRAPVAELTRTIGEKMAELKRTIVLRQQGRGDEALRVVLADRGKDLMDRARRVVAEIRAEEDRLLARRLSASRAAVRSILATFSLSTTSALFLLIGVAYLQHSETTERERAAEVLRRREAWISTTLESIGDAVIATDREGRVTILNPIARSLTGWSREGAAGRPLEEVFSIINESTRKVVENPVAKVIREGVIVGLANHTLLIARDGTETPIDDSAAPIKDDQGEVAGVVLVFRDISERKAHEALEDEQRRLAEFGRDVGLVLTESPDLATMLERCARETVRHLDGAFVRIWTLDETGETLELKASAGLYTHLDGSHARIPVGKYKIGRIARERKPHLTNEVIGDPHIPEQEWAGREGMVAFAGYPLVVEDQIVGVWAMFSRHPLSQTTLQAMESVASTIALGIEQRRLEQRLRWGREWFRVTLASIGDAVITTDGEGRVTFLNPVAEALTGWPLDDALGREIVEVLRLINELSRQPAEIPVERVLREGVTVGLANHTVLISRDGAEVPIEDSAAPIRDARGEILGVVMVLRDVTEERKAEAVIEEAGRRLRFTLDATRVGQWDMDLQTGEATQSLGHDRILGYESPPPGWNIETFLKKHVHADSRSDVERSFQEAAKAGGEWELECPITRVDGLDRWIWMKAAVYSTGNGHPGRMLGLVMDVTARKQAEEELRLAKETAEEANRAKTQFLAVLSHELRTPLNPILLATTAMLECPGDPEDVRTTMEMIRQNVNLQARLIDDLLDVMRIVRGKMPLHWEVADCHQIIRHAIEVCRSEIHGKDLRLETDLAAKRRSINVDSARLQQVFWNLIKNAVKFTTSGGSIAIRTRNELDPGEPEGRLVIEVSDTGIGIEPAVLPLIFDAFQQGETTITRKFGGLGLGLAICRGIVEAHGGELIAASEGPGRGTTFRVVLKGLPESEEEVEADRKPGGPEPVVPPPPTRPLSILVVEDEPATMRLMARLLRGLGYEVIMAGTIESASEAIDSAHFDLIISDIGLPDGSGLELMRRAVALRGPVPAIALTGYGMEEDIRQSREAGFTAHMTKPIDFAKLSTMIRQVAF